MTHVAQEKIRPTQTISDGYRDSYNHKRYIFIIHYKKKYKNISVHKYTKKIVELIMVYNNQFPPLSLKTKWRVDSF